MVPKIHKFFFKYPMRRRRLRSTVLSEKSLERLLSMAPKKSSPNSGVWEWQICLAAAKSPARNFELENQQVGLI